MSSDRLLFERGLPHPSGEGHASPAPLAPPAAGAPPVPDLPWTYADDRVALLVRDPRTLFAYWDFAPDTITAALAGLDAPRIALRVWQLSGREPRLAVERDVVLDWRGYYVPALDPHHDYRAELVAISGDTVRALGRASNVASLPNLGPSPWIDDIFAAVPADAALPTPSLSNSGRRALADADKRLHGRAYELSGGGSHPPGPEDATSSRGLGEGFGGRSWSGTLVRR